jgi:hypothetical protein
MSKISIIVAIFLSACAVDQGPVSSADQDTSSTEQDIVNPDTVCGLPQRCAPWDCWTDGITVTCNPGGQSDLQCQVACGTLESYCPLIYPMTACHAKCDPFGPGPAGAICFRDCVNNFTTSCQTGRDDL